MNLKDIAKALIINAPHETLICSEELITVIKLHWGLVIIFIVFINYKSLQWVIENLNFQEHLPQVKFTNTLGLAIVVAFTFARIFLQSFTFSHGWSINYSVLFTLLTLLSNCLYQSSRFFWNHEILYQSFNFYFSIVNSRSLLMLEKNIMAFQENFLIFNYTVRTTSLLVSEIH